MGAVEFDVSRWIGAVEVAEPAKVAKLAKVGVRRPKTLAELAALAAQPLPSEQRGSALATWREGLDRLNPETPPMAIKPRRWRQMLDDARRFLSAWGATAVAFGWTELDLFGVSPGFARRLDRNGLIYGLQGRPVVAMTADTATIDAGGGTVTRYYRMARPGTVTWWSA